MKKQAVAEDSESGTSDIDGGAGYELTKQDLEQRLGGHFLTMLNNLAPSLLYYSLHGHSQ